MKKRFLEFNFLDWLAIVILILGLVFGFAGMQARARVNAWSLILPPAPTHNFFFSPTTWYVTTTGSDANPCTLISPCATPDHAFNAVAVPGDTVQVAAGTYSYGASAATFTAAGTAGNPITVTCATRGACKITNTVTGNATVVQMNGQYQIFDGFEVTNSGAGNNLGIYVNASNVSLTRNTIHDIQTDCGSSGGGGIQVAVSNLTNIVIDSNRVYNISWISGAPKCPSTTVQTDGILSEQTGFTTSTQITNNIVYNVSGGWGILASTNAQITNNTVFNTVNGGIALNNAPVGATIQNNIIVSTGLLASDSTYYGGACAIQNGTSSTTTYGHNDLFGNHGGNYGTGFGCSGSGLQTGDIAVDPSTTFVNWQQNGAGDYREKLGSSTIGAGVTTAVTHDYAGTTRTAPFDMGAYQYAAVTWFVRSDGGPIFYPGIEMDACDGQADTAMTVGGGPNQHCAVNDFRYLYDNGQYANMAWVVAGGDTIVVRGCKALSDQQNPSNPACRIGYDTSTGPGSGNWCAGTGPNYTCSTPNVPSGTALNHTRILGACAYGTYTCTPVTRENLLPYSGNLTQIFGGFAVGQVFALAGSQYVDMEGLEITAHNNGCSGWGAPPYPKTCSSSSPSDDYAGQGIVTSSTTSHLLLQDVYIHGLGSSGIYGPTGAGTVLTRVALLFNTFAGWNMDAGGASNGPNATLTQSYLTMIGNGCQEEYPIVHSQFPAKSCYDSSHGGFGDSWSGQTCNTTDPNCSFLSFTCDHCWIAYNTKDGAMGPHVPLGTLSLTNSFWAGNLGAQGKWSVGPSGTFTFENNIMVADCERLEYLMPGAAQSFGVDTGNPGAQLGNCRGNDMFAYTATAGSTAHIRNNTFVFVRATDTFGNQEVAFDLSCSVLNTCGAATLDFTNNVFLGYPSLGVNPALTYQDGAETSLVHTVANNVEYRMRAGELCGVNGVICADPLLLNAATAGIPASNIDVFVPGNSSGAHLTSSSPAINAGATYTSPPTADYYGTVQTSPLTIGSVVFTSGTPTVSTPTFSPVAGTYAGVQTITIATATGGASIVYTVDGTTPTVTPLTCTVTHGTPYSGPVTVASSSTIKAIGCLFGDNASIVGTAAYVITPAATPTFSPVAGTYVGTQAVTLSTATTACSSFMVWNTTNAQTGGNLIGTTSGSSVSVAASETVYAQIQGCTGVANSAIGSAAYVITAPTSTPQITISGATISGSVVFQ